MEEVKVYQSKYYSYVSNIRQCPQNFDEKINKIKVKFSALKEPIILSTEKIQKLCVLADHIRNAFDTVVVIGMGGAIIAPMVFTEFIDYCNTAYKEAPKIHYIHHLDLPILMLLTKTLNFSTTAFVIISQSGETIETIALYDFFYQEMLRRSLANIHKHFFSLIECETSTLYRKILARDMLHISYEPQLGNRFAAFASAGLLLCLIKGGEANELCRGAMSAWQENASYMANDNNRNFSLAALGAMHLHQMLQQDNNKIVNLTYLHNTQNFLKWHSLILSEVLADNARGFDVLTASAPFDHHSQIQSFLAGPPGKIFSLLYAKNRNTPALCYKPEDALVKILDCTHAVMIDLLSNHRLPFRELNLNSLNLESLGAVMMHNILESMFICWLEGLNPTRCPSIIKLAKTQLHNKYKQISDEL